MRDEPVKRMSGGKYRWVKHRLPIKGGISFREVMQRDLYDRKPVETLWKKVTK